MSSQERGSDGCGYPASCVSAGGSEFQAFNPSPALKSQCGFYSHLEKPQKTLHKYHQYELIQACSSSIVLLSRPLVAELSKSMEDRDSKREIKGLRNNLHSVRIHQTTKQGQS